MIDHSGGGDSPDDYVNVSTNLLVYYPSQDSYSSISMKCYDLSLDTYIGDSAENIISTYCGTNHIFRVLPLVQINASYTSTDTGYIQFILGANINGDIKSYRFDIYGNGYLINSVYMKVRYINGSAQIYDISQSNFPTISGDSSFSNYNSSATYSLQCVKNDVQIGDTYDLSTSYCQTQTIVYQASPKISVDSYFAGSFSFTFSFADTSANDGTYYFKLYEDNNHILNFKVVVNTAQDLVTVTQETPSEDQYIFDTTNITYFGGAYNHSFTIKCFDQHGNQVGDIFYPLSSYCGNTAQFSINPFIKIASTWGDPTGDITVTIKYSELGAIYGYYLKVYRDNNTTINTITLYDVGDSLVLEQNPINPDSSSGSSCC